MRKTILLAIICGYAFHSNTNAQSRYPTIVDADYYDMKKVDYFEQYDPAMLRNNAIISLEDDGKLYISSERRSDWQVADIDSVIHIVQKVIINNQDKWQQDAPYHKITIAQTPNNGNVLIRVHQPKQHFQEYYNADGTLEPLKIAMDTITFIRNEWRKSMSDSILTKVVYQFEVKDISQPIKLSDNTEEEKVAFEKKKLRSENLEKWLGGIHINSGIGLGFNNYTPVSVGMDFTLLKDMGRLSRNKSQQYFGINVYTTTGYFNNFRQFNAISLEIGGYAKLPQGRRSAPLSLLFGYASHSERDQMRYDKNQNQNKKHLYNVGLKFAMSENFNLRTDISGQFKKKPDFALINVSLIYKIL